MKKAISVIFSVTTLIYTYLGVSEALMHPDGFIAGILAGSFLYYLPLISLLFKSIAFSRGSILLSIPALLCDLIVLDMLLVSAIWMFLAGDLISKTIICAWLLLGIIDIILIIPASKK